MLYSSVLRDVGISGDEEDKCMKWAFGEHYGSMPVCGSHVYWNTRHKDIFEVYGYDNLRDTIARIGRAYQREIL